MTFVKRRTVKDLGVAHWRCAAPPAKAVTFRRGDTESCGARSGGAKWFGIEAVEYR
jgi:hypothetical protein